MHAHRRVSRGSRRRRTKDEVAQLERQIIEVLEADNPQSVRHVFYRMTDPRLPEPVDKSERGYRVIQNRITVMRRNGKLPYGWISDATRRGYHTATFDDAGDFFSRMKGLYRADLWSESDHFVEVWCESRSIAGVIEVDCRELAVSLYPCGGFSSITLAYEAAQHLNEVVGWRDLQIIYIGDFDPAGVLIDKALENELCEHLDEDIPLRFHRIAITEEQIAEHDLSTKPRKPGDRRALHVRETVEAEAMPAAQLRAILRQAVENFLPEHALAVAKAAEESETAAINLVANTIAEHGTDAAVGALLTLVDNP